MGSLTWDCAKVTFSEKSQHGYLRSEFATSAAHPEAALNCTSRLGLGGRRTSILPEQMLHCSGVHGSALANELDDFRDGIFLIFHRHRLRKPIP
jgi:hypothetical protein